MASLTASPTNTGEPLKSFHNFAKLPSELRVKIWTFALLVPRLFEIKCKMETERIGHRRARVVKQFYSSTGPPPLLQVNQESRFEALNFYDHCFSAPTSAVEVSTTSDGSAAATGYRRNALSSTAKPNVYVSWERDTIRIPDQYLAYLQDKELFSFRNLIIEAHEVEYFCHYHMPLIRSCKSLQTLMLNAHESGASTWRYPEGRLHEHILGDITTEVEQHEEWEVPYIELRLAGTGELRATRAKGREEDWIMTSRLP